MAKKPALDRRSLGSTGLALSSIGFGAGPLGHLYGLVSPDEALAAVRRAISLGINFFDTSPFYGGNRSETILGNCFRELSIPRDQLIISTKCGRYIDGFDFSADRVSRSIDESLGRLRLDFVDILLCHDIEFGSLDQIVDETIPALQKIKAEGKARFIGMSGYPLGDFKYVLDRLPIGSVDVILSYCHYGVNDSTLADFIPYFKSKGVGVITAAPVVMGLLTENGPPDWHPASPELKSACRAAAVHCKEKGKNISKIALQYSLMNTDISTVLVGMESVGQVEDNVGAALELSNVGIDEELLQEVEAILKPVKNQTWPSGNSAQLV